MSTVDDIIAMKNQKMLPFENKYKWFFMSIENDLVRESDGENRVKSFLSDYDYKAKLYIVHQFMNLNDQIGTQLFDLLDIDSEHTFLEDKYADELVSVL